MHSNVCGCLLLCNYGTLTSRAWDALRTCDILISTLVLVYTAVVFLRNSFLHFGHNTFVFVKGLKFIYSQIFIVLKVCRTVSVIFTFIYCINLTKSFLSVGRVSGDVFSWCRWFKVCSDLSLSNICLVYCSFTTGRRWHWHNATSYCI